ncbi:unnamed protein product [Closterium sp. NIES-65]|nr:unnamed protein product [Closterium sp. NIES-65]
MTLSRHPRRPLAAPPEPPVPPEPPESSEPPAPPKEPSRWSCEAAVAAEPVELLCCCALPDPSCLVRPSTAVMATPSVLAFDAEGRAIDFEVWVDDLQLFLQCDRADGLSLFDLTSGASPAPAADADPTMRSQWATRDAAARLAVRRHLPTSERAHFSQYKSAQTLYDAVVARYSSPATAALSRLILPYLFPDLSAFPTVADLITHLRTSDTRYRAALPAEFCAKNPPPMYITLYNVVARLPDSLRVVRDHFLAVCPTTLTVDLLEKALLAAEKSIVAVGASGTCLVLSRSARRLPLVGDAALARARGARARVELEGAVEVAVEAAEGVGVAAGVVEGVVVVVVAAAAEAAEVAAAVVVAAAVAVEAVEGAEEQALVAEGVELVGVVPSSGAAVVVRGGGAGPCAYVLRSGDRAGEQCGGAHPTQRCFGRLTDAWRQQFPEASEIPRWDELLRGGVAIFDLDFDAILAAMYAVTISEEGDFYHCFPPDPGIGTAALGACEAVALGASASALSGTGETALSGTASPSSSLTFTLDSGASRSFFRDRTTLTPLGRPVAVSLVDPSGGSVLSHFSTVLPCPAAPSGTLSGLYLPSFSTNLVSGADLLDAGVHQFTPASQRVTHCMDACTGRHLATFSRRPGSSLYTLTTTSPPVPASGQVAASGQVFAAASRSGPESAPCSCRLLSYETLLWHHHLGHPSLPRLRSMASRVLVSGLPQSLPSLPSGPGPSCVPCVEGRLRAAPHSSQFPLTEAPLQTLHMDVWGPAPVRGQGHERYFLLVVDDYSRYTTVFPLRSKGAVTEVLIDWIREACLQLRRSFGSDFPVLRLHSDRGGEFSSRLLRDYSRARGIRQTFTLPDSPQQNGIAECRIGMVMDVGDASAFRVWGSPAFVRDLSADKLSPRAAPCVFLGFPPDAPGWQFYHPSSRRVLSSQDVTFDESVPFYRLFPYRTPSLPPPPDFLVPVPPPVDPLPPQVPAPSGVSQVDAVDPVEVTGGSGAASGAEPGGADSKGAVRRGAEPGGATAEGAGPGGAEPGVAAPGAAELGGAESGGAESGAAEPGGARSGAAEPGGATSGAAQPRGAASGAAEPGVSRGAASRREPLSPQELREWFARRWRRTAGAGASSTVEGAGAAGSGAAGPAGPTGAGAAGGVGAETPAVCPGGGSAAGAAGGPAAEGAGAVPAESGAAARPRPYFVPLLQQVLGLSPPVECPQPVQSQSLLEPSSPLPAPSPYTGPIGVLAERREPASRPASPVRAARASGRGSRQRPPPVPSTHRMSLRPSTAPLRAPLPSPSESSLPALAYPESDSLRAASPTVTRLLATFVTDPSFECTAASALLAELVDFAARCRLDYAASLVAEAASVCPPSVGGECALGTDVLEDRQEELQCLAAASPHLASVLLAPEGDPDALDIPTPRSYAEAVEGPYSSQLQAAMDAKMASWKSTGTYVDAVPPPGANIVSGMWIFRVKRPPGSPPVFKARYVARGFSQRQGVD